MHVHVLQHVPHEHLGSIQDWLEERHARITYTRLYEAPNLPAPEAFDLIIALGGPMGANEEERFAWLTAERRYLNQAIRNNQAVLGICLGAQIMARAMDAKVYPATEQEYGWFPIQAEQVPAGVFQFPPSVDVFHWHQETFDLPDNSFLLASSAGCHNQAFQLGARAIGLQFHLEVTPQSVEALRTHYPHHWKGPFAQDSTEMQLTSIGTFANANALMHQILDYLTAQLD